MEISKELIESCVTKVKEERSRGATPEAALKAALKGLRGNDREIEEVRNRIADVLTGEICSRFLEGKLRKSNPNKRVRVWSSSKGVFGSIMNERPFDRHELQLPKGDRD